MTAHIPTHATLAATILDEHGLGSFVCAFWLILCQGNIALLLAYSHEWTRQM